ncbi:hypothetical protein FB451DRAFT_1556034 [Mycena latifolia]|nr:hypothetical protein FB451DRAFT_1556034 [Mycena latifolia]
MPEDNVAQKTRKLSRTHLRPILSFQTLFSHGCFLREDPARRLLCMLPSAMGEISHVNKKDLRDSEGGPPDGAQGGAHDLPGHDRLAPYDRDLYTGPSTGPRARYPQDGCRRWPRSLRKLLPNVERLYAELLLRDLCVTLRGAQRRANCTHFEEIPCQRLYTSSRTSHGALPSPPRLIVLGGVAGFRYSCHQYGRQRFPGCFLASQAGRDAYVLLLPAASCARGSVEEREVAEALMLVDEQPPP